MEDNTLEDKFFSCIEKIYHIPFLDIFYQGETKVLTFIARCKIHDDRGYILPSDISKSLNMTSPRISNILNNLEKKGYIKRDFSIIDRRKVYIYLTKDGKDYVKKISNDTKSIFNSMLEKLGEHDVKEFIRIINRLVEE